MTLTIAIGRHGATVAITEADLRRPRQDLLAQFVIPALAAVLQAHEADRNNESTPS